MTLVEFLLARIAEDEAAARAALDSPVMYYGEDAASEALALAENEDAARSAIEHFARHKPARALADCEAKRQIVAIADTALGYTSGATSHQFNRVLWFLAKPYAEHPDYDGTWRP